MLMALKDINSDYKVLSHSTWGLFFSVWGSKLATNNLYLNYGGINLLFKNYALLSAEVLQDNSSKQQLLVRRVSLPTGNDKSFQCRIKRSDSK